MADSQHWCPDCGSELQHRSGVPTAGIQDEYICPEHGNVAVSDSLPGDAAPQGRSAVAGTGSVALQHSPLEEIKRELGSFLPPDRVGGLLTLAQERWLVEQYQAAREALEVVGDYAFGTWEFEEERLAAGRRGEALARAVLDAAYPASEPNDA